MDTTYVPSIGDSVFLHRVDNNKVGSFYSVVDVNGDTMAVQAAAVVGDHLEETDKLDVILLTFNKKNGQWEWQKDNYSAKLVATFMTQTSKVDS